ETCPIVAGIERFQVCLVLIVRLPILHDLVGVDAKNQKQLLVGDLETYGQAEYLVNTRDRSTFDVRQRSVRNVEVSIFLGFSDRPTDAFNLTGLDKSLIA